MPSDRLHAPNCSDLVVPEFDHAERIGEFWGDLKTRIFAELLIDCEEDRMLKAVLVGLLREVASRVGVSAAKESVGQR